MKMCQNAQEKRRKNSHVHFFSQHFTSHDYPHPSADYLLQRISSSLACGRVSTLAKVFLFPLDGTNLTRSCSHLRVSVSVAGCVGRRIRKEARPRERAQRHQRRDAERRRHHRFAQQWRRDGATCRARCGGRAPRRCLGDQLRQNATRPCRTRHVHREFLRIQLRNTSTVRRTNCTNHAVHSANEKLYVIRPSLRIFAILRNYSSEVRKSPLTLRGGGRRSIWTTLNWAVFPCQLKMNEIISRVATHVKVN